MTARWIDNTRPAECVVEAVAELTGSVPTDLQPLHEVVDYDALNELFHAEGPAMSAATLVQFQFEGCAVTVHGNGWVVAVR